MQTIGGGIDQLKKVAAYSDVSYQHAAGILSGDDILVYAYNKRVGTSRTIHAEMNVLLSIGRKNRVRGMDIIVVRVNRSGQLKNSRPCDDCIIGLNKLDVRKVYYSDGDGKIVVENVSDMQLGHVSASRRGWRKVPGR